MSSSFGPFPHDMALFLDVLRFPFNALGRLVVCLEFSRCSVLVSRFSGLMVVRVFRVLELFSVSNSGVQKWCFFCSKCLDGGVVFSCRWVSLQCIVGVCSWFQSRGAGWYMLIVGDSRSADWCVYFGGYFVQMLLVGTDAT